MIGFDSTNLNIEYIFGDDIGIDKYTLSENINYIFSKYLYYKYPDIINSTIIKYVYGIYDSINEVIVDNNLSNVEKLQLLHQMLMSKYNACNISIVSSIKNPNNLILIFTYETSENTKCIFVDNEIINDKLNGYISTIRNISYNKISVNAIDDYLFFIKKETVKTPTTSWFSNSEIEFPDLMLVKSNVVSNEDFLYLKNTSEYKELYIYSNYLNYKSLYSGFAFKITFNGYEKMLYINGTVDNYKLKNELNNILLTIKDNFSPIIFNFEQLSYIVTNAEKVPYRTNSNNKNIDYFPNPFVRQDNKFTFNSIKVEDLPEYVSINDRANQNLISLKKQYHVDNIYFKSYNEYLYNYLKEYNEDSTDVSLSYNSFILKYSSIKKYENFKTKQLEFQDINGEYMDSNIGTVDNSEFIDIQGFDTTSGLPLILYVSKNIDYSSFYLRQYKLALGGVVPINNEELIYKYDNTTSYFIVDFVVSNYMDNWFDYDKLHSYIYNIDQNFDDNYKFNKISNTDILLFHDFEKTNVISFNNYIYKNNDNTFCFIKNVDRNILPCVVLKCINENDNVQDVLNYLDNYFVRNNLVLENNFYNNSLLYFSYIQTVSYKNYFLINTEECFVNKMLNFKYVKNLYDEIKRYQLNNIYSDSTIYTVNFKSASSLLNIEVFNSVNIANSLLEDVVVDEQFNLDNTTVAIYDDVMSVLLNENIYKVNISNISDSYLLCIYDYKNLLNSENKLVIFNKVIGVDQYAFYSLFSDENDYTLSEFFINVINNFNKLILLYDIEQNKIQNLSISKLIVNTNNNNPIIINKDLINDYTIFKINKTEYNKLLSNYFNINNIYNLDTENILYSYAAQGNGYIFNINNNDIIMVK